MCYHAEFGRSALKGVGRLGINTRRIPKIEYPWKSDFLRREALLIPSYTAGRSGLAVACLTAVREVLGSNRAVGSCVYRTTTVIYSLGHGLCEPFLQCLGQLSLLPSVGR